MHGCGHSGGEEDDPSHKCLVAPCPATLGAPSDAGVLLAEWTSIDDAWWGARGRRLDLSPAFLSGPHGVTVLALW
jgi:hypothetical protein